MMKGHVYRIFTCEELHGHNWKIEAVVAAKKIDRQGLALDTFGGVQTPSFRAGKDYAALSINPEQTTVFRPWCRRIDNS